MVFASFSFLTLLCLLVVPGNDNEMDQLGDSDVSYLNGKPVRCALGRTPLEAWSQCLIQLGLVDEVIVDKAMEAVKDAREAPAEPSKDASKDNPKGKGDAMKDKEEESKKEDAKEESEEEPVSEKEKELLDRLAALREEFAQANKQDKGAETTLAENRISRIGKLMCNPFIDEGTSSHQTSWMAAAVRKEKAKMGSTGNKRKIVTATDLLERNNTFYNNDVEALIEGLPGSEYCTGYTYHANRGVAGANRALQVQELRMRQEKEKMKRTKQTKEAKARAAQQREKELKRKKRDDERDARKRQKMEEEEEKKKLRAEERLSRLAIQVDDRLSKEAAFQREKVVLALAKSFYKEMNRRRKAAELVAGQVASEAKSSMAPMEVTTFGPSSFCTEYDEEIMRIWDFVSTFGKFFVGRGYMSELPTLDSLQTAIDTLRGKETKMSNHQAISFTSKLAVSLCKPLAAGLTRMLFASLIALNPALQKDFGAAFFNEVNSTKTKQDGESAAELEVLCASHASSSNFCCHQILIWHLQAISKTHSEN